MCRVIRLESNEATQTLAAVEFDNKVDRTTRRTGRWDGLLVDRGGLMDCSSQGDHGRETRVRYF